MSSIVDALTQINLNDLVNAFGWQGRPILASLLQRIFMGPAVKFAHQMAEFDLAVGKYGLVDASRLTIRRYVRDLRIFGADRIPASAFLALSNHPGMADTLSLFTALNRPDLHVLALGRPFLDTMTNISKQLFYLRDESASRVAFVRQVSAHLRNGGSALTFPAGHIEPDPEVHEGAVDSLRSWTDSAGIFIRMAPQTAVLPVLVRGVVWDKAAYHPLTYLKRTRAEREKLAAALQLLGYMTLGARPVTPLVQVGKPIYSGELGTTDTQSIHQAVMAEMTRLIENPPEGDGVSAL